MFTNCRPFPGVTHITDAMGVSFTLVEGDDSALLFDAGYGLENVADYVRSLTGKPVKLILSHGHHDHILGARWFDRSLMDAEDLEEFQLRIARPQREKVQQQAESCGLITSRRDGKEVYYRAADNLQANALHHMIEQIAELSCPQ